MVGAVFGGVYQPIALPNLLAVVDHLGRVESTLSESRKAIMLGECPQGRRGKSDYEQYRASMREARARVARLGNSLDEIERMMSEKGITVCP